MPRLTPVQRQTIVALSEEGYTPSQIAARVGTTRSTIYLWLERKRERDNVNPLPPRPRQRITTEEQDRQILAAHQIQPLQSIAEMAHENGVGEWIIRKRLREGQQHECSASALLTQAHREDPQCDYEKCEVGAAPVACKMASNLSRSQSVADKSDSPTLGGGSPVSVGDGGRSCGPQDACAACGADVSEVALPVHGTSPEQFVEATIFPRGLNDKTLLCNDCSMRYCNEGKQNNPKSPRKSSQSKKTRQRVALSEESVNINISTLPTSDETAALQQTITLPNYKIASCRPESCLFPNCNIKSLHFIPQYVKQCLLQDYQLYTPEHSRICKQHLLSKNWEPLLNIAKSDFTAQQIEDIILILKTYATAFNVKTIEDIPPNLLLYFTGIDHRQLQNILAKLPILSKKTDTPLLALIAYLTKLKTNESFDRLSALFQIQKQRFDKLTQIAKDCMLNEFVPGHLKTQLSSDKTTKMSEITADDLILGYLQYFYEDGATTEGGKEVHERSETLASSKLPKCWKRKNNSDSENDSLASKVRAKKQLIKEVMETNESTKNECKQFAVSEVEVEFVRPERADVAVALENSEDKESVQLRMMEVPDNEGKGADKRETGDSEQNLLYAPKPTDHLKADSFNKDPGT